MATIYPAPSAIGQLEKTINQLRRNFPSPLTVRKLSQLQTAKGNESAVRNVLVFLKLIDENGYEVPNYSDVFYETNEEKFQEAFAPIVQEAYQPLFDVYGSDAWDQSYETLVSFFRREERCNQQPGQRRANVFVLLAALAGKRTKSDKPTSQGPKKSSQAGNRKADAKKSGAGSTSSETRSREKDADKEKIKRESASVGVSVKIEVNLPGNQSKETYDYIFRSIKENLID